MKNLKKEIDELRLRTHKFASGVQTTTTKILGSDDPETVALIFQEIEKGFSDLADTMERVRKELNTLG